MSATAATLTAALEAIFTTRRPQEGQWVNLKESGIVAYRAQITRTDPSSVDGVSLFNIKFFFTNPDLSKVTWYAMIFPLSLGGGGAAKTPFQISDATVGGVAGVLVQYGMVNALTPTYSGTSLSLAPVIPLVSAGTWRIYLDSVPGTSCIVQAAISAQPAENSPSGHSYKTIGEVDVVAVGPGFAVAAIRQATTTSLNHSACGSGNFAWMTA